MGEFAGQKLNDFDSVNMSCGEPRENEEEERSQKSAHLDSDEDTDLDEEAKDIEPGQKETESTKRVGKNRKNSDSTEARARIYRPTQKKPVKRTGWTPEEREAVAFWMKDNIRDLKCPTMSQCVEVLEKESRLYRRSWKDVKF